MKIKLLIIILLAAIALPAQSVTVSINSKTTFQTMDGFGYSQRYFSDPHITGGNDRDTSAMPAGTLVMTTDQQNELLDQLHTNLGLNRVRPMILGLIEPVNDNNDPNVTDLALFNFDGLRNDAQIDYVQRAIPRGLTTYFISPVWLEPWKSELLAYLHSLQGKDEASIQRARHLRTIFIEDSALLKALAE